jgi:hypothetical protein
MPTARFPVVDVRFNPTSYDIDPLATRNEPMKTTGAVDFPDVDA